MLENDVADFQSAALASWQEGDFMNMKSLPVDMQTVDTISHAPVIWSMLVMLSIVSLLVLWEQSVIKLRQTLPTSLISVVNEMLAEMGGIGFIGLFLSTFITGGALGKYISEMSSRFLGDEDLLVETFEFLHHSFFEVGIGFFVTLGLTVGAVLAEIKKISMISEVAYDINGDGDISVDELAVALDLEPITIDLNFDGIFSTDEMLSALQYIKKKGPFLDEITMSPQERSIEALVIRERLIEKYKLSRVFEAEKYFEQIFAKNLERIVELSPITWIPLIPFIALVNSVDLSHEVVSAASPNAITSCGEFIASPWVLYPSILLQLASVSWAIFNFWKMATIKGMLIPTICVCADSQKAVLLPPRYLDEEGRRKLHTSPGFVRQIESSFVKKKPRNGHEELFGAAGSGGAEFYRNSLKLNIWLSVAQIVLYCSEIVLRDLDTLLTGGLIRAGNPTSVFPEIILYSVFVLLSFGNLALAPLTILNYSYATSIESMTDDVAMRKAIDETNFNSFVNGLNEIKMGKQQTNHNTVVSSVMEPLGFEQSEYLTELNVEKA